MNKKTILKKEKPKFIVAINMQEFGKENLVYSFSTQRDATSFFNDVVRQGYKCAITVDSSKPINSVQTKVFMYYSLYGSNKHDVLVIQVGGEPYDTVRNHHVMLDPHDKEFGANLFHFVSPYLSDDYEIQFIQSKKQTK